MFNLVSVGVAINYSPSHYQSWHQLSLSAASGMVLLPFNLGMLYLFMARNVVCPYVDIPTHITLASNARIVLRICPISMAFPDVAAFLLFIVEFRFAVLFRTTSVLQIVLAGELMECEDEMIKVLMKRDSLYLLCACSCERTPPPVTAKTCPLSFSCMR